MARAFGPFDHRHGSFRFQKLIEAQALQFVRPAQPVKIEMQQAQRAALAIGGNSLRDVAAILGTAYVDCVLSMGPEVGAVFAALSASEEMDEFHQSLREGYMSEYRLALSRFVNLPDREGDAVLAGLLGAAETLSEDAAAGRVSRDEAIAGLSAIFAGTLERYL